MQFRDKICLAVAIECLTDIGADAGAGTNKLICQYGFPFGGFHFIADFDNFQCKDFGLGKERTVSHHITCFKFGIQFSGLNFSTLITYYFLLVTLPKILHTDKVIGKK